MTQTLSRHEKLKANLTYPITYSLPTKIFTANDECSDESLTTEVGLTSLDKIHNVVQLAFQLSEPELVTIQEGPVKGSRASRLVVRTRVWGNELVLAPNQVSHITVSVSPVSLYQYRITYHLARVCLSFLIILSHESECQSMLPVASHVSDKSRGSPKSA